MDNLRVHHSRVVKKWVEVDNDKISISIYHLILPKKTNEYLNCNLKSGVSESPLPKNQEQLRNNEENHIIMLQKEQQRVKKYFKHQDIKYVA